MNYEWRAEDGVYELRLIRVPGTRGVPYLFGGPHRKPIEVGDFAIGMTPVTQALWVHVMGSNPARAPGPRRPVENISWEQITGRGGFLDRLNNSAILDTIAGPDASLRFRLPSEAEWEYAARGGPHWTVDYAFSGSNNPNRVAWYGPRWNVACDLVRRAIGWRLAWRLLGRPILKWPTHTHDVGLKQPNQLGLYDMSGNVWEWCQDVCTDDIDRVPASGSPYEGPGNERRLRGGCHHNWDLHCRVWWRYGIQPDAHDGCIGFRVVLAPSA